MAVGDIHIAVGYENKDVFSSSVHQDCVVLYCFVSNIMSIIKHAHNALLAFYDKTINETTCEKDGFFHLFYSFILPNIISYSSLSST